eukprot:3055817-Pleurochrysis_carterae.AAC.3
MVSPRPSTRIGGEKPPPTRMCPVCILCSRSHFRSHDSFSIARTPQRTHAGTCCIRGCMLLRAASFVRIAADPLPVACVWPDALAAASPTPSPATRT